MKLILLLALFITVNSMMNSDHEEWKQFKKKYRKRYESLTSENKHFEIFQKNVQAIKEHNSKFAKGRSSYRMSVNKFTDISHDEFISILRHEDSETPENVIKYEFRNDSYIPNDVDWREKGAITEVKDQGNCGGCWAFSAAGSIEAQIFLHNHSLISLSAQHLVDCVPYCKGCKGGSAYQALRYAATNGIANAESYPWTGEDAKCRTTGDVAWIANIGQVPPNEEMLKRALATVGPISVAIDSSGLEFYADGIFDSSSGCESQKSAANHAVLLVGYGTTEDKTDFWILKNSWGTNWGENGYFRLKRNDNNTCGVASLAFYPLMSSASNVSPDSTETKFLFVLSAFTFIQIQGGFSTSIRI